jgi:hypothetical protein
MADLPIQRNELVQQQLGELADRARTVRLTAEVMLAQAQDLEERVAYIQATLRGEHDPKPNPPCPEEAP